MNSIRVSVIVPVYNAQSYLKSCLDCLLMQSIDLANAEFLLIDDGSTDSSLEICNEYAEKCPSFRVFSKENGGQSTARNLGLSQARGKYILFLDADDTITLNTLQCVADFFDANYDEIDLLTYRLIRVDENGHRSSPHVRYNTLCETKVYDLTLPENVHIAQSAMNIVIKNRFENNILFDEVPLHEDMKYCIATVRDKLKIGFCSECEYLYLYRADSTVSSYFYAYYIFESTMEYWEQLFASFPKGEMPKAIQAYYLNDYSWKTGKDILLPYHYEGEQWQLACRRVKALIEQLDDDVILSAPYLLLDQKIHLIKVKHGAIGVDFDKKSFIININGMPIYKGSAFTVNITRIRIKDDRLYLEGFTKSPLAEFEGVRLRLANNSSNSIPLELTDSHNSPRFGSEISFKFFEYIVDFPLESTNKVCMFANLAGHQFPAYFVFSRRCALNDQRHKIISGNYIIERAENSMSLTITEASTVSRAAAKAELEKYYFVHHKKAFLYRQLYLLPSFGEIWLYSDRDGFIDNAYYQFKHDINMDDGIRRFYVANNLKNLDDLFTAREMNHVVRFRSEKHMRLFLHCTKLITAYIERDVCTPFGAEPLFHYMDLPDFEMVYLQHGVMHAKLANMYSREMSGVDKIVISSSFERQKLTESYNYLPGQLIESGMPSLDNIDTLTPPKNKILFSPSWRRNLIGKYLNGKRALTPANFLSSSFFNEIQSFLNSPTLNSLLERYNMTLEFKNHPIFEPYNNLFNLENCRTSIASGEVKLNDYNIMITDFSSIVFNFVYLERPIVYFAPDYDLFKAGVTHTYRELDLPIEDGFGPFTRTAAELLDALEELLRNNCEPSEKYRERMKGFFIEKGAHRDRLYKALMEE